MWPKIQFCLWGSYLACMLKLLTLFARLLSVVLTRTGAAVPMAADRATDGHDESIFWSRLSNDTWMVQRASWPPTVFLLTSISDDAIAGRWLGSGLVRLPQRVFPKRDRFAKQPPVGSNYSGFWLDPYRDTTDVQQGNVPLRSNHCLQRRPGDRSTRTGFPLRLPSTCSGVLTVPPTD